MASKLVRISDTGWRSLSALRDSIKLLFDVDMTLKDDAYGGDDQSGLNKPTHYDNGGSKVEDVLGCLESDTNFEDFYHSGHDSLHRFLLFETESSPENIEKAQKYSCACFPSDPRYKIITLKVDNPHIFEMVHRRSTHIQQSTASLLKFDPDCLQITVQGDENCVELAREKLEMILDDPISKITFKKQIFSNSDEDNRQQTTTESYRDSDLVSPTNNVLPTVDSFIQEQFHTVGDSHLSNDGLISADHSDCYIETDGYFSQNVWDNDCPGQSPLKMNIPSSDMHHLIRQKMSTSSSSAVESDDDNNVIPNALTDSRNARLVEQAAKLGYSVNQIEIALDRLSTGCSPDDLLSELIRIGNEQPEVISPNPSLGDQFRSHIVVDSSSYPGSPKRDSPAPPDLDHSNNLRSIVIDGSNVAMSHGQNKFSCRGIQIVVDWFRRRGHSDITVFVPKWRKEASRPDAPIEDQHILLELEREKILSFTPSRRVRARRIVSYDDRYILKHAIDVDGIVVSNDVYRDLVRESEEFQKVVDQHLLMYSFVKDKFMPPDDPLGRLGPPLDDFLRKVPSEPAPKPQDCPYGKKCTYGNKCRFYHPERGFLSQKSISDTLKEQASINLMEIAQKKSESSEKARRQKQKLARTRSLIPVDSLISTYSTDVQCDGNMGRTKPKLTHSKSLMMPKKTGDYLTESRLKLEAAESEENIQRVSPTGKEAKLSQLDFPSLSPNVRNRRKGSADLVSRSHSPSPRASPVPSSEDTLIEGLSGMKLPPSSSAHLTVPSQHSQPVQESYSSGHLSVAKKLSDEGSEKSFFEGCRSTPSPDSSRLDDISSLKVKKPVVQSKLTSIHDLPPEIMFAAVKENDAQKNVSKPLKDDQRLDNAFQYGDSSFPHSIHLSNTDSGNCSTYSLHQQPPTNHQGFRSVPLTTTEDSTYGRHQNLHRSLSSSHSVMKGHKVMPRRASQIPAMEAYEHARLRMQQSNPLHSQLQGAPMGPLQRQNSSSNPEVYARSDLYQSDRGNNSGYGMYHSAPLPGVSSDGNSSVQEQTPYFLPQTHVPTHQMNYLYAADQYPVSRGYEATNIGTTGLQSAGVQGNFVLPSYPVMGPHGRVIDPPVFQKHQFPQGHQSNLVMPTRSPYNPLYYAAYPHTQQSNTPPPHFYNTTDMAASHLHHQGPTAAFQGVDYPLTTGQAVFSPVSNVPQPQYQPSYPQSCAMGAPQQVTIDPDADISPQDSRYECYCHLSTVYGEKVVKNFMNRNPDVKDFNQLIDLIGAYKVETGQ